MQNSNTVYIKKRVSNKNLKLFKKIYPDENLRISPKTMKEYKLVIKPKINSQGLVKHYILKRNSNSFKKHTLTFGNTGKDKYRKHYEVRRISENIYSHLSENIGIQYGQDRAFSTEKSIGICDGHGLRGEITTTLITKYLVKNKLDLNKEEITDLLCDNKIDEARDLVLKCFREVYQYFRDNYPNQIGGSTFSIIVPFCKNGRRFIGGFNLGDSESYIIKKNKIVMISDNHNWENKKEYQLYVDWCKKNKKTIKPAVYGRFCCGSLKIPNKNGKIEPHPIFDIEENKVKFNMDNYNHLFQSLLNSNGITKNYITGGYQSMRKETIDMFNKDTKEWEVYKPFPGTESSNWGSSILIENEGGSQLTRSIMDWKEEKCANTMSDGIFPHIQFEEIRNNEDIVCICHSDGFGDTVYLHEIFDEVKKLIQNNPEIVGREISEKLYKFIENKVTEYGGEYIFHENKPYWDDVSISVLRWKPEK